MLFRSEVRTEGKDQVLYVTGYQQLKNFAKLTLKGDVIWEIEFRGSKRAEVEHHSYGIYHYMSQLREKKLEFVGMSSVGPSIAVVTALDRKAMDTLLKPLGLSVAISTKVDNTGMTVVCEK